MANPTGELTIPVIFQVVDANYQTSLIREQETASGKKGDVTGTVQRTSLEVRSTSPECHTRTIVFLGNCGGIEAGDSIIAYAERFLPRDMVCAERDISELSEEERVYRIQKLAADGRILGTYRGLPVNIDLP